MSTHNFSDYRVEETTINVGKTASATYMSQVFLWMFAALGISAVFAFLFASSPSLLSALVHFNPATGRGGLSILGWAVMLAPIGFVMMMSFAFQRLSYGALVALFLAYSAINGISFSFILLQFTAGSVISCFLSAAVMFGVMAVMGYTTKKDLTSFGRILSMGLIGILVAMVINFFMHSSGLDYLISIVGVGVFVGLTAWDVQKLKNIGTGVEYGEISAYDGKKIGILGALTLYLDFINIFLFLLRLFGSRRD
ncbi:Bax inhibitor-1/YccA family protein [Rurimicrobium arvi]|uniref:Bax inhibitor-1/YccA family protein n=1 Tax=Rurimicrobium arvi TaxID=2049916 RepID=A0ABP8MMU7_9BACT